MAHIHNETVLAFLKAHSENLNIQQFLAEQKRAIQAMNRSLGTRYRDYLDYLEDNSGDDADWSIDELKALLGPCFAVTLSKQEQSDYEGNGFEIILDELIKPVYIKDEGHFFSVWDKQGRVDIPVRLLKDFLGFLNEHGVAYQSEYDFCMRRS